MGSIEILLKLKRKYELNPLQFVYVQQLYAILQVLNKHKTNDYYLEKLDMVTGWLKEKRDWLPMEGLNGN